MIQTTTLWDFPSQNYGEGTQGDQAYVGATPSYIIWNLLHRYTKPGDRVLDPMCGSGTTLDVCKDVGRHGLGFDLNPSRPDIKECDARALPHQPGAVDFVFIDPPYSTHVDYSDKAACIGKLDAREADYYAAMETVIAELFRVLKDGGYLGLYVSDSHTKGRSFCPIGFELFLRLCALFEPVDIVAVSRHNKTLKRNHWYTSAIEGNYYLRGFNYLFVVKKALDAKAHEHEQAGTLSRYFKAVAASRSDETVTPEVLHGAMVQEKERLDAHVERKERKKQRKVAQKRHKQPIKGKSRKVERRGKAAKKKK